MDFVNLPLLAVGALVFVSVVAGLFSVRIGFSFLVVFLLTGILAGEEGIGGFRFDDYTLSFWVGNVALAIILLDGGLRTKLSTFRVALRPSLVLATVGVALTALAVGLFAAWVLAIDWRLGLLLGAIVGSTDAAAVFAMLKSSGTRLNERVANTLEIESGVNDPMAIALVTVLIELLTSVGEARGLAMVGELVLQFGLGTVLGIGLGRALAWAMQRASLGEGLGALLLCSGGVAAFALVNALGGSGFIAVYLVGLVVGNRTRRAGENLLRAMDGMAWLAQSSMFLLLGLLVAPHRLLDAAWPTLAVAVVLMFVARPLAVALCLAPLRFKRGEIAFIGWVGLRGAVPIVLALFPLLAHLPDSYRFFNVAFAVVLLSLLLQGTTLPWVARWVRVAQPPAEPPPGEGPVAGRLVLDASLPVAEVFEFFKLPLPESGGPRLADWLTETLARGHGVGDGIEWHGARFEVRAMHGDRIVSVGVSLLPAPTP
ncbi:MAG: potassium/proton antiporter [Rhizobacter sp.]|nr:potassium/proton antiporter [Rhizobacter sp.]